MTQEHRQDTQPTRNDDSQPFAYEYEADCECKQCGQPLENEDAKCPNCSRNKPLGLQKLGMAWVLVATVISALVTLKMIVNEWNGNTAIASITNGITANALGIWIPCYLLHRIYSKYGSESSVGVGGILGFITLTLGSVFLFFSVASEHDDSTGFSLFFVVMTLWVGAILATIAAERNKPR